MGGGHSLHVTCDLTLASKEHAIFKQTDADVASFDGGFGSALLARQIGQKEVEKSFFLVEIIQLKKPSEWEWLTLLYLISNLKTPHLNGARNSR